LFAACVASHRWRTPKLHDFPPLLLPDHGNVTADTAPFADRFWVQLSWVPSRTVVSHIAKDSHYYIHHDASRVAGPRNTTK
jgi:DNA (cytosine-5)-methyltransferase 1